MSNHLAFANVTAALRDLLDAAATARVPGAGGDRRAARHAQGRPSRASTSSSTR